MEDAGLIERRVAIVNRQAVGLPVTVFVTAYDQYALRAFDAAAVDYIVKPISLF